MTTYMMQANHKQSWFSGQGLFYYVLLIIFVLLVACQQQPKLDPQAMQIALGQQVHQFYKQINRQTWQGLEQFLTQEQRNQITQVTELAFIAAILQGQFSQLLPTDIDLAWKKQEAVVTIVEQRKVSTHVTQPVIFERIGQQKHRWIIEDGRWRFAGVVP